MMKHIVFDLGGVLFHRNPERVSPELIAFFSFIFDAKLPRFWEEYDRGTLGYDEVIGELCRIKGCDRATAHARMQEALVNQEPIRPTAALIADLKAAGYGCYVLSNMSCDYIRFLRRMPVYALFDGEVVSCEEGVIKPEPRIYEILLDRYGLDPAQTLFIDDRRSNLEAAARFGISTFHFTDPEAGCRILREQLLNR